ncbi:MAG: hypothetical protein QOI92_989 [Chloroflexota bacterium]|jgi:hypothetical protein|nr:hypothetical protein [Chloroflexota bacterium]
MNDVPIHPGDELEEGGRAYTDRFRARVRAASIWSWPICIVGCLLGFMVIAGFVPPPGENWSAQHVAHYYAADRTAIRIGLIVAMFFSALLLPFLTAISAEMRKIEGQGALLAPIQFGGAVVLVAFFQIICLLWLEASLRPENNPQLIREMNDYGWLVWTMLIPTGTLQFLAIAITGFMDRRRERLWPRWAAYANIWVAITYGGGVLAVFFKTGPFSWTGAIGFWMPTILWAAGMTMNMVLILRRDARMAAMVAPATAREPATATRPPVTVATG